MPANLLLVLGDDPRVLKLLVEAGEHARYAVTPTESIRAFRAALDAETPTLLAIDVQTQGGLGSDVLLYLQRIGCTTPIIVLGGSDSFAREAVRQAQTLTGLTIVGTLFKPFPPAALTALLDFRREPDLDEWAGELDAAIEAGQLGIHYLPIAEIPSGRITGFEALARWFHPRRGLVSPGHFIPIAEATGLMEPLTDYVLARSLENLARWSAAGFEGSVAVNVAAASLTSSQIVEQIGRLLATHGLPPHRLTLEVAEGAAMRQPELTSEILSLLERRGVGLALDDFGTGYTSLRVLSQLPFDEIKIDRAFVSNVLHDPQTERLVRAIVGLGRSLNVRLVAEGVETADVWHCLTTLGIERCQGFAIARPMPSDRVLDWLHAYRPLT
jgi:EAL domain-containing protein (putative c-di-GMP-specific phosphodiesterase class I)